MADFSNVFGPFGPALDPAMGRILSTNPEALIPFFAAQGISPPKDPTKLASLGGGTPDAAGGQPPLEAGYPEQPQPPVTSTPPPAADAIRGYRPEPSPTEQPPASEPLTGYQPPGPGEPGYVMQSPTAPTPEPPPIDQGARATASDAVRRARLAITGALTPGSPEDPEAAVYGGAGVPPPAAGAAAATPPATPGAGAAAAPPMAPGTGFNTFGALGGLYPAAVPGGGGGAGEEAITGVPLPPSDPRRQGGAAAAGGTTGKSQQEAIKQLSQALAGIKAPPAPTAGSPHPAVAHGGNVSQSNPLAAFLAQYMSGQGGAAPAAPLRLYQTVGGK